VPFGGVFGVIRESAEACGEMGVSRRFGGFGGLLEAVFGDEVVDIEDEVTPRDSKALILDCNKVDGAMAELLTRVVVRAADRRSSQSFQTQLPTT
jgi:hypothetical protein